VTVAECESVPLAPATVARKLPATLLVQERVEPPDPPLMLVEEREQERLVELVVTASETVPENPLTGLIVIVDVPAVPTATVTVVGLAAMVKSAAAATW
jgi:hypothetical protein